jgi:hypothetical protein
MSGKAKINDFELFVGTLLFGLFALLLVTGPAANLTLDNAELRVGLSALLLGLSFYLFKRSLGVAKGSVQTVAVRIVEPSSRVRSRNAGRSRAA